MSDAQENYPPPPLVFVAAYLVPGAGYWLIGQRKRALTVGITIIALFVLGIWMAGIRVVEAPNLRGSDGIFTRILQKPWFLGQLFTGALAWISAWISHALAASATYGRIMSHARLAEMGTLYTAVAGMLNLLAMIDSAYRAGNAGRR